MDEYISREAVVRYLKGYSEKELNHNGHFGMITSSVLDKAERAISEMPAADVQPVSHWISVKDRLPEHDGFYLAWFTFEDGLHGYDIFYYNCGVSLPSALTHWMPLPQKPESEE